MSWFLGLAIYMLLNLYISHVASIINPLGMRLTYGTRQTLKSACKHALFAALVACPALLWSLIPKRTK